MTKKQTRDYESEQIIAQSKVMYKVLYNDEVLLVMSCHVLMSC